MKRFNFGTFVVGDANREAFETCKAIAGLERQQGRPVLLLGDEGCGKTHLLYSIVNRVRAQSGRTGLAYVTASDFPRQVRELINDPSPVGRAESAILLVDQLERFEESVEELEAVVRIFMDNGHAVVLASSTHPARLHNLSRGLGELLDQGRTVHLSSPGATASAEEIQREMQAQLAEKEQELERLRAELSGAQAGAGMGGDMANQELETARAENAELARKLSLSEARIESTERELAVLQQERGERKAQASLADSGEAQRLRAELEEARTAQAAKEETIRELQEELDVANGEKNKAQGQAAELLERAEALLAQIDTEREQYSRKESARQTRINELEQQLAAVQSDAEARVRELEAEAAELRDAAEEGSSAERRLEELQEELATLQQERDESQAVREELAARVAQLEDACAERDGELDVLRKEAASQVAAAQAQAGELEARLTRMEAAREQFEQAGQIAGEIAGTAGRLGELAQELIAALAEQGAPGPGGFSDEYAYAPELAEDTGSETGLETDEEYAFEDYDETELAADMGPAEMGVAALDADALDAAESGLSETVEFEETPTEAGGQAFEEELSVGADLDETIVEEESEGYDENDALSEEAQTGVAGDLDDFDLDALTAEDDGPGPEDILARADQTVAEAEDVVAEANAILEGLAVLGGEEVAPSPGEEPSAAAEDAEPAAYETEEEEPVDDGMAYDTGEETGLMDEAALSDALERLKHEADSTDGEEETGAASEDGDTAFEGLDDSAIDLPSEDGEPDVSI